MDCERGCGGAAAAKTNANVNVEASHESRTDAGQL